MQELTNFDIEKHNNKIKDEIENITKPLTIYQIYIKEMRQKWNNLNQEEKNPYLVKANLQKQLYNLRKQQLIEKSEQQIKKLKIYLIQTNGRVSCVGLDNGFTRYTVIGPVTHIELFTEKEINKLKAKNIKVPKYKSIDGLSFNWRVAKKYNAVVYGGSLNNNETWWKIQENYKGTAGKFTNYINYKGETWTVNY